jgi:hypothetical protein
MVYGVTMLMSVVFPLAMPKGISNDAVMRIKCFLAVVIAITPVVIAAQVPQGQGPGLNAAMAKFFGDNTAFTATATATIRDAQQKDSMTMPMSYALLDGKIRSEVDMTQVKSKELEGSAAQLKQMGMDRTISIVRPDQQKVLVIYPSLRAYAETPMTDTEEQKSESTPLGEKQEAIVWNATDLKNFPVKMEMKNEGVTTIMTYTNIKFEKPDAKLFDPPAGFDKYDSVAKLMQVAIMKMLPK